jgi:hypothetical protein
MDHYKKKLKRRMILFAGVILVCVGLLFYNQFWASDALLLAYLLFQHRRILTDETKLRLSYNRENDERVKAIRAKSGFPMVIILSMLLIFAGMVAGYFNTTVFAVLVAAALFQMFVCAVVKFYYLKKM